MSPCLLQREENIVLSDANCIVSLLYVNRCTHHGHNGYIFDAAWGGPGAA